MACRRFDTTLFHNQYWLLLIGQLGTKGDKNRKQIPQVSYKKMHLKMTSSFYLNLICQMTHSSTIKSQMRIRHLLENHSSSRRQTSRRWNILVCFITKSFLTFLTYPCLTNHTCMYQPYVAYSAPSHYLNQCWNIVDWILQNKLQCNLNRNVFIYIQDDTI